MRSILVTGSDTGVGKTWVVGALARLLGRGDRPVQIVKVVETGRGPGTEGDAALALRRAGGLGEAFTLASFPLPVAPAFAAAAAGGGISMEELADRASALPDCAWRIFEGAGGIATPVDGRGRDWADFAAEAGAEAVVIVVADRLGAINQARLACGRAAQAGLRAGVWLNRISPLESEVAESNRAGLRSAGVAIWAEQGPGEELPSGPEAALDAICPPEPRAQAVPPAGAPGIGERCRLALAGRDRLKLRRRLRVTSAGPGILNLADNDYLGLARDPAVAAAAAEAAGRWGTSASASPLITGWREVHEELVRTLCAWHGFGCGLLWSSGYAANSAVLGTLPAPGDPALADRLIHRSMIAGLRRSGARIRRYPHLDLDSLERWLGPGRAARPVFVVTESVFSMDGDYPDLRRLAELRRRSGFFWVLDEAHALGWYGPQGAGLAAAAGVAGEVDVLVGTFGKALASGGAYTLFRDEAVRDYLVNFAGEFVYSTALAPTCAAAALAAAKRVRELAARQGDWQASSRAFRAALRAGGWAAPEGDSPVVPVRFDTEEAALSLAESLRGEGILAAAVRPPTVPAGTSRLRFSLKRGLGAGDFERVLRAMDSWRERGVLG